MTIDNLIINLEPALYLVPTPIGNLDDITIRALKTLSSADVIACEDTRTSLSLLRKYDIRPQILTSCHEYNEKAKGESLAEMIESGKSVALVSDAGSPALSDPGFRTVNAVLERGLKVIALPGATALVPALSASGFPSDEFMFMGFPPQKKGRQTFIKKALSQECTVILYESTHRIVRLINEIVELDADDKEICIAREISKIYEEYIRGTAKELQNILAERKELKGEIVVLIRKKAKFKADFISE
jgi:16S rRNA (cytidine1402-2'-O)-methyltransferase